MLKGFRDFIMRGNVVDLAIAVVIGTAFGAVVNALVAVLLGLIGKAGGTPDFSEYKPGGLPVGAFITALISFLVIAAVVYFFVVVPLNALSARRSRGQEEAEAPSDEVVLLTEIRDALRSR